VENEPEKLTWWSITKRNSFAKYSYCIYSGVAVIQKSKQMIQCQVKN